MVQARDALCAGDTQFVFATDGGGALVWGYPERVQTDPSFVNHTYARNFPDGAPLAKTSGVESRPIEHAYTHTVINLLLRQQGRESLDCPPEECFDFQNMLAPLPNRPDCCLARKLRAPVVESGIFSVAERTSQSTEAGSDLWNPLCVDWLDVPFVGGILDIISNTVTDAGRYWTAANPELQSRNCTPPPMGTFLGCPAERPFCQNGECITPSCEHVKQHCNKNTLFGVRVRQSCPNTCGCTEPRSPLTLSLPESGCPSSCLQGGLYLARRQALPCEDLPKTDPIFVAYLDDLDSVRLSWPMDIASTAKWNVLMLRTFGCDYFRNETFPFPQGSPPYKMNGNLCTESSEMHPYKPLSYFCPVACGCRKGLKHCPDSCPSPSASDPICPAFQQTVYANPYRPPGATGYCPQLMTRDEITLSTTGLEQ